MLSDFKSRKRWAGEAGGILCRKVTRGVDAHPRSRDVSTIFPGAKNGAIFSGGKDSANGVSSSLTPIQRSLSEKWSRGKKERRQPPFPSTWNLKITGRKGLPIATIFYINGDVFFIFSTQPN